MQINSNRQFYSLLPSSTKKEELESTLEKNDITTELEEKENDLLALDAQEKREVLELQAIDTEVRTHEAAHQAAGGALAGAASFTYQKGPDGRMYAVAGEVPISTSSGSTPQESIAIAQQVRAAALAPGDPSPQDLRVAASAFIMELKAEQQLAKEEMEKTRGLKTYETVS